MAANVEGFGEKEKSGGDGMSGIIERALTWIEKEMPEREGKEWALKKLERFRPVPRRKIIKSKANRNPKFKPLLLPIPRLKKDLDRVFSLYIRQRDSDGEAGKCCTCGLVVLWRYADCGHYQLRQYLNTRWDEKNCALQCKGCNGPRQGEMEKMAIYIDKRWGEGTAEILRIKAKQPYKSEKWKLQLQIDHYKKLIGE